MKSSLRHLRHIQAIPALATPDRSELVDRFAKEEEKAQRITKARSARRRRERETAYAAIAPEFAPYLNSRQHDSFVIDARREGSRFTLTATDEDLAVILEWTLGLDRRVDSLTFEVVFEGVTFAGWRAEERDGTLRSIPPIREFIYTEWGADNLIAPELPGVRWALSLHHQRYEAERYKGSEDLLLLVEAASMRIVEPKREEWIRRFGEADVDLFDRYQAIRAKVSLNGHPDHYAHLGIDRADLRSTLPPLAP